MGGGALKNIFQGGGRLFKGALILKNLFQEGRLFEGGAYSRGLLFKEIRYLNLLLWTIGGSSKIFEFRKE